uniref:Uncharacterized protein n=1 Tax=Anguilla anguilla TaxID=7936 RepID=A0A0E9PAE5_ANGAN
MTELWPNTYIIMLTREMLKHSACYAYDSRSSVDVPVLLGLGGSRDAHS